MKKYLYELTLEAKEEKEAESKMTALIDLVKGLSTAELIKLAHIVKHDPIKKSLAKKYLNV